MSFEERDVAGTIYLYGVQVDKIVCRENFSQSHRGLGGPRAWVSRACSNGKWQPRVKKSRGKQ